MFEFLFRSRIVENWFEKNFDLYELWELKKVKNELELTDSTVSHVIINDNKTSFLMKIIPDKTNKKKCLIKYQL